MPTLKLRAVALAGTGSSLVLLVLAGCSAHTSGGLPAAGSDGGAAQTVRVEVRDIHSVVVVTGNVVASPSYAVSAGRMGVFSARVHAGQQVRAGQQLGVVAGSPVAAVSSGTVTSVAREGQVPAGMPLVTIVYNGFGVSAPITDAVRLRLYGNRLGAKASLEGGAGGFDCSLVDPAMSPDGSAGDTGGDAGATPDGPGAASALCLMPLRIRAFPGMPAHLGIDMGAKSNVLALPLSAVSGSAQEGTVAVVTDSTTHSVDVGLGVSDGNYVQITSGLKQGDEVLLKAPLF